MVIDGQMVTCLMVKDPDKGLKVEITNEGIFFLSSKYNYEFIPYSNIKKISGRIVDEKESTKYGTS